MQADSNGIFSTVIWLMAIVYVLFNYRTHQRDPC